MVVLRGKSVSARPTPFNGGIRMIFKDDFNGFSFTLNSEAVFVNLLRSPGINSQPVGPVRQPYLTNRPTAGWRNQFLGIHSCASLSFTNSGSVIASCCSHSTPQRESKRGRRYVFFVLLNLKGVAGLWKLTAGGQVVIRNFFPVY